MALDDLKNQINAGKDAADDFKQTIMDIDSTLKSLGVTIAEAITKQTKKSTEEVQKLAASYEKDVTQGLARASKFNDELLDIQKSLNAGAKLTAAQQKKLDAAEKDRLVTLRKIEQAKQEGIVLDAEELVALDLAFDKQRKITSAIEERAEAQEASLGIVGKISSALTGLLDKLGMGSLNKFFNLDKANAQSKIQLENLAKSKNISVEQLGLSDRIKTVTGNITKNFDGAAAKAGALLAIAKFLFNQFIKADEKIVDLQKNFSLSREEATKLKNEFGGAVLEGDLLGITFKENLEAAKALNKALGGTAIIFDKEANKAAAELQSRLGVSAESTGELSKLAFATGKPLKNLAITSAEQLRSAEKEFGIRLNLKNVLEDAGKITGQTRLNLDKFPGGLTKAVSVAKSLGVEMDAIAGAAGQLLDFQTSIEKEMEAELLLGRNLNLEAARQAALVGDQEGLMRELVREAGSLEELQNMNVIQQQALAAALGLSVDQLSDQVLNGEALAAQKDEELKKEEERNAAEIVRQETALTLADKQRIATENLASTVQMLGGFMLVFAGAAAAAAIALSFGVASGAILTGIVLTGAAIGALGAGLAANVEDGVAPPGKGPFTITDKFGATTVTAAGDGIAVSPNIQTGNTGDDKAAKELMEMKNILKTIANKPEPKLNMDSIQVGTVAGLSAFPIQ